MTFALTDVQHDLAATVRSLAAKAGRGRDLVPDDRGAVVGPWDAVVELGLHVIHLPDEVGGQGGSLLDLGVVLHESGYGLLPGSLAPTAIAAAVLNGAEEPGSTPWLRRIVAGERAALVRAEGLSVVDGTVSGTAPLVLGGAAADLLVVVSQSGCVVVEAGAPGVAVTPEPGVDRGRDLAAITFSGVTGEVVAGITVDAAREVEAACLAAEAAGVIAWCAQEALDYALVREQFGRPIGSFQAVQHRVARLKITSALATAAAWDAVRSLEQAPEQRTVAVAAGALVAVGKGVHAAVECLGVHGAIGFTAEHDLHLFWRRAISLAALVGGAETWESRLGAVIAAGKERDFAVEVGEAEETFRAEVRAVIEEAAQLDNDPPPLPGREAMATGARRDALAAAGLVASPLAPPYGRNATPAQQFVLAEEFRRAGIPQPTMAIAAWILPLVINRGSAAQVERLAPATLQGRVRWCQLFSEPGAGSDMAAISLRATPTGDGWLLNGQKVWTTESMRADYGLLLARTSTEGPRRAGLSMFFVDLTTPGVEVRPIRQANGDADFAEVYFTDVVVPADAIVGEPGDGWNLMLETLGYERLFIGTFSGSVDLGPMTAAVREGRYGVSDVEARRILGRTAATTYALQALALRDNLRRLDGQDLGAEVSIGKAAVSVNVADAAAAALELAGPLAALDETRTPAVYQELDLPTWVIGGGTIEIQLNAIASFVLGMPRG
ncbi:acyl-CoA dehydrogenase [Nocardioides massiliensis]|uniref:Alkylation response protein AidB-like acyl-CoA dehydrogenase n=1 Tax=Nocardioides massiliensis TaxID=1325935 RepID=A0ABT9NSN1_9ACTN|nr:acyl-CoA dehydrogenase [Nocardioides massiliensis]MDP9823431.1 alkylation response protein AidB-like acyl-CoA dehydrogenase [Nocardioides massiliensis]